MVTGPANPALFIAPGRGGDPNRRTRIAAEVDGELRGWLRRAARVHAHLAHVVRLFGDPSRAGGQSLLGDQYAERVAKGDRTVLHDALTVARNELDDVREEIQTRMDAAPPTTHAPGTAAKVAVMTARVDAGQSLFIAGDAKE